MLPYFQPMPVGRSPRPFSHLDWIYEIKWDGFRSLAYLEDGRCRLISRNGNEFKSFPALNLGLPRECHAQNAVLDGEIVCLDKAGNSQFKELLFRRGEPRYYAFDLLFSNGEDLRYLPLADRKQRLRDLIRSNGERLLHCDHVEEMGEELFAMACQQDLEGIVAKRKIDPYVIERSSLWLKIRNRKYSQWVGREELFERERHKEPVAGWHSCASACAGLETII
jgi:bifunctional non-homologous end joining protein LigD